MWIDFYFLHNSCMTMLVFTEVLESQRSSAAAENSGIDERNLAGPVVEVVSFKTVPGVLLESGILNFCCRCRHKMSLYPVR
jgi:hypothetical protein